MDEKFCITRGQLIIKCSQFTKSQAGPECFISAFQLLYYYEKVYMNDSNSFYIVLIARMWHLWD